MDASGCVVHQGQGGPANILSTPRGRLKENLRRSLEGCPRAEVVCGCFAGLLTEADRTLAHQLLEDLCPGARVRCEPDYTAALMASDPPTTVCVIAGTGSVICSRSEGQIRKTGARGYLLGNPGSAFAFGRDAVRDFLEHGPDGAGEAVRCELIKRFGSLDENEIVAAVHRSPAPAAVLARLAAPWGRDAAAGHVRAIASVEEGMGALALQTAEHVARYASQIQPLHVTLAGGMWSGPPLFREVFGSALCEALDRQDVVLQKITQPPVRGAVRLAMETQL